MNTLQRALYSLSLGLIATGSIAVSGFAAETTSPPAADTEAVVALEKFEITGEKLGRTAQESQLSVAGYTGREIERTTDTSLFDVFQRTANTFANDGTFTIRGLPNTGFSGVDGSDLATVLVDGGSFDRQMVRTSGLSIWDVDQVEILRGPQSTSQGRNSLAGAVIARTRNPTFHWDTRVRATFGEENASQLAAAFGGPLVPEVLAFRVSVDQELRDGSTTNITRNEDDWDRIDNLTLRGKLLLQPSKWRGFSALLTYAQIDSDNGERAYAYGATRDEIFRRRVSFDDTRNEFDSRSRVGSLEVNQEFSNGWLLTSTTAWSDFRQIASYDADRTATEHIVFTPYNETENKSQEVRLLTKGERWRLLGGLYAAEEVRTSISNGPFSYRIPSPLDTVFGLPTPSFALLTADSYTMTEITNTALFLNGDWKPSRRWTLTAGVRFDREKTDRDARQVVGLVRGFPDKVALIAVPSMGIPAGAPADVVIQNLAAASSVAAAGTDKFNTILPMAGITFHWSERASTGLTVTRGYRSGGVSFNQKRAVIVPFDPEYTTNYELSFRSQWLDRRVTLNANAFYVDWKDQQVSVQLSNDVYDMQVENAGRSTYYGFEVEARERLAGGWNTYQTIGHTRSRFDEFLSSAGDYAGNEFPNAPRWTLGAGVAYEHASGWFGTASLSYVADTFSSSNNNPNYKLGNRRLLNAKFGYAAQHWSIYMFGSNLLDHEYFTSIFSQSTTLIGSLPGRPRQVGLGIETRF